MAAGRRWSIRAGSCGTPATSTRSAIRRLTCAPTSRPRRGQDRCTRRAHRRTGGASHALRSQQRSAHGRDARCGRGHRVARGTGARGLDAVEPRRAALTRAPMSLVRPPAALGAAVPLRSPWLLWTAAAAAAAAGGWTLWHGIYATDRRVTQALIAGLVAAGATALGTLPMLMSQRMSDRARDAMLGFGAGVMLAASAFSLVVPAIRAAQGQGHGPWGSASLVGAGILLGALLLVALDQALPHEHFIKGVEGSRDRARALKRAWLFVFAISLHNLPEGLAIGVAFAGTHPLTASALATGIAIQDVPEGLVIAVALRGVGYARGFSVALGAVS